MSKKPQSRHNPKLTEAGRPFRFVKGFSGNPGGKKSFKRLTAACQEILASVVEGDPEQKTVAERLAEKLVELGLKGNLYAISEIADRAEGRSIQGIAVTNSNSRLQELISALQGRGAQPEASSEAVEVVQDVPALPEPDDE